MALNITTLSIVNIFGNPRHKRNSKAFIIITLTQTNGIECLCVVSHFLIIMPNVTMMSVIILSVVMLNVIMLSVFLNMAIKITLVWTVRLASEAIASAFIVCALTMPQQETELRNCESEELAIFKEHAAIEASVVAGCRKDGDLDSFV